MVIFLLKSAACMAIFLAFYKLFLEKESMHTFKRFYLLGALLVSFLIPSIVFTEYVEATPINFSTEASIMNFTDEVQIVQPYQNESNFNWELVLLSLYGIGVLGFGFRFVRHLVQIESRIRKNPKLKTNFSVKVLLQEQLPPHTFFSYIFLNKQKFEAKSIPDAVLLHEETHAQQKHSLDVLFIEFLQVVFWFNPIIYLFKKSIKLNHEFLADSAVILRSKDPINYQNTLLSYLSHDNFKQYQSTGIANAINYSSIKKRFKIMKKETSKKGIVLRSTLLLPLLAILLFGFSETKIIIQKENAASSVNMTDLEINPEIEKYNSLAKKYNAIPIEKRVIPLKDLKTLESLYRGMSNAQKEEAHSFPERLQNTNQDGATKKQIATYNQLAKKYNTMMAEGGNIRIKKSDVDQLTYIYGIMSEKQKSSAQPFPDFPEPPLPPKAPRVLKGEASSIPPPSFPKVKKGEASSIPPPVSPKVKKGEKSNIPPPPMPKAAKTRNNSDYVEEIIENQDQYDVVGGSIRVSRPAHQEFQRPRTNIKEQEKHMTQSEYLNKIAQKNAFFYFDDQKISVEEAKKIIRSNHLNIFTPEYRKDVPKVYLTLKTYEEFIDKYESQLPSPPAPPSPKSPLDHVVEMAKKGATFMYEDETISSDKAIELLKNNKELNIESRTKNGTTIVRITKDPVTID